MAEADVQLGHYWLDVSGGCSALHSHTVLSVPGPVQNTLVLGMAGTPAVAGGFQHRWLTVDEDSRIHDSHYCRPSSPLYQVRFAF